MLSSTSIHPEQQQAERDNNLLLFWGFFLEKATNKRQIDSAVQPQCAGPSTNTTALPISTTVGAILDALGLTGWLQHHPVSARSLQLP